MTDLNLESWGYVLTNNSSDIRNFNNLDLFDTLNQPATRAILNESMPQHHINKHLLTAIITVNNKLKNRKNSDYNNESTNIDFSDILNEKLIIEILNGNISQSDVNKHLLTAILTINKRL